MARSLDCQRAELTRWWRHFLWWRNRTQSTRTRCIPVASPSPEVRHPMTSLLCLRMSKPLSCSRRWRGWRHHHQSIRHIQPTNHRTPCTVRTATPFSEVTRHHEWRKRLAETDTCLNTATNERLTQTNRLQSSMQQTYSLSILRRSCFVLAFLQCVTWYWCSTM